MRALVKQEAGPGLVMTEVPEPEIGINDVLIRVDRTGICGTDLHIEEWNEWAQQAVPIPLVIGHEFVGEIVEIGSNVKDYGSGDLVSGEGHVVCGRCRNCMAGRRHLCADARGIGVNRPGAFAELIALPVTNVWHHDASIDRDVAAIFDPFGNAVHSALQFPVLGEDVLITGAGPIGLMAAAVVRHAGARYVVITDVNPYRLELARKMGVTVALDVRDGSLAETQEALGMKEGFDVGLEMSGNPAALRDMVENLSHGASIAMLGSARGAVRDRLEHRDLRPAHDPRRLRPGDVRDLVHDDGDAAERPRHRTGDHAPLPRGSVRGSVRGDPHRGDGQGAPALDGRAVTTETVRPALAAELEEIRDAGLEKPERVLTSPQRARVRVRGREGDVLNLCANNYLGLADHPEVIAAAHTAMEEWGFGLASVRFICGTQELHKDLEDALSAFLGMEDTILYGSCFDANGGLFEVLLGEDDAVISDELNHASIIDGVRLSKAKRFRYRNNDMDDLETQLKEAAGARRRLIATDGVFSMDGYLADLSAICDLAERHDAMVMVDDSHAVGFMGPGGRGTPEHHGVMDRVDILTGTMGKALGGASGGYLSGPREVVELLRQRSRPYLFSNTIAPAVVGGSLKAIELLTASTELRDRLEEHTRFFRAEMEAAGLDVLPGEHPIVPVMLGDAALAGRMAEAMLEKGVYVIGFSYPVVPKGKARIRAQVSAAHTREDLSLAVEAFAASKEELT